MIGRIYAHPKIVSEMSEHSVARAKYSPFLRSVFKLAGPLFIRLFGYPLDMEVQRRVKPVFRLLELTDQDVTLDVGCGVGYFTFASALTELHSSGDNKGRCIAVGADIDVEDIMIANKVKKVYRIQNTCFTAGDGLNLPFKKHSFNKILASELIEHIKADAFMLKEFSRVLKPSGLLVLTTPYKTNPIEYKTEHYKKIKKEKIVGGHVRSGYNLKTLREKLAKAGLEIVDTAYSYGSYTRFARRVIKSFLWLGTPLAWIISLIEDYVEVKEGNCIIVSARKI